MIQPFAFGGIIVLGILSCSLVFGEYEEYDVFLGLEVPGVEEAFEIPYDVKRNLFDADVEILRKSITFTFAGNVPNDTFTVILPDRLIEGPFTVWLDKTQLVNFNATKDNSNSILKIPLVDKTEQVIIVGGKIAGQYTPKVSPVINKIFANIENRTYLNGENILVNGKVENKVGLQHVTLEVLGPQSNSIIFDTIPIDKNSMFAYMIVTGGPKWSEQGNYTLKISGADANTFTTNIKYANFIIPQWLKTNAGWWAQDLIDDETFAGGIQFLIKKQVIRVPVVESSQNSKHTEIPDWIKTNAEWWYKGKITDSDFIVGIQFLVESGIIKIS